MKNIIAAVVIILGCSAEPIGPPPPKVLPTYTVEHGEVRMAHSERSVGRSFLLIGNEWYQVQTSVDWRDAAGKTAVIVRQSDGRSFLTIDGQTGEIEEPDGERDSRTGKHP